MKPSPALARGLRAVAYALLALGAFGAVCSVVGLGIAYAAAREHVDTAIDALRWSGIALCGAAALFLAGRYLGAKR